MYCTSGRLPYQNNKFYYYYWCYPMIIAVILCPPDLVLLVRSGPVIRDLGGSVRIWGDNGPVLISYFYDGAVPVKVFQNRSQSDFYMDNGKYGCFLHRWKALDLSYEWSTILVVS